MECMDLSLCYPTLSYLDLLNFLSVDFCDKICKYGRYLENIDKVISGYEVNIKPASENSQKKCNKGVIRRVKTIH